MDTDEAFGLTDPVAFDQVLKDREGFFRGEAGVEQRRALAFREAGLTGLAVEQADLLMFAVAIADGEVARIALTVERTSRILAAEAREVVHGRDTSQPVPRGGIIGRKSQATLGLVALQCKASPNPLCKLVGVVGPLPVVGLFDPRG